MAVNQNFEHAFSPLHASPDTLMEVQKKMQNEKKAKKHLTRGAVAALAAVLTLSVAFAAAKVIGATLHRAEEVDGNVISAFGDGDISAQKAVIFDSQGNQIDLPDMVRENTDADTVARLVGDYLYDVEGTMTAGDYTLTLQSLLMDEQGMGIVICRLENPDGIEYRDVGYGQITLPVGLNLCMDEDAESFMDAKVYLNAAESSDTCLQLVVYFGSFQSYQVGDPIYVCLNEIEPNAVWQVMELQPLSYAPTAELSADGHKVTVSALGITVENPVERELLINELVLHFIDGTDYVVQSEKLHQMNPLASYWQGDGSDFPAVCYVFNRLVDVDALSFVTLEGSCYTADNGEMQVSLEYRK